MVEFEQMLGENPGRSIGGEPLASVSGFRLWRIMPIILLAGAGAAFALMPTGVKDALMTGRSVAHSPTAR